MRTFIYPGVEGIRLFGSRARYDYMQHSDIDVLVVVDGQIGIEMECLQADLDVEFKRRVSLSVYGINRILEMFQEGHLFVWHLFYESRPIHRFPDSCLIAKLGKPNPYVCAIEDIDDLRQILDESPVILGNSRRNLIYECGIFYICARNIAMAASAVLT